jgi:hypothetical protein
LLPEIHLINPWLLVEKRKPIIIRDGDKGIHLVFIGMRYDLARVKTRLDPIFAFNTHPNDFIILALSCSLPRTIQQC